YVYNRTKAQERVRDLVKTCAFARQNLKAHHVILCGLGNAGPWTMLAAPAADGVVADCNQLDTSSDASLLQRDLFFPGIRVIGDFEGALLLSAPNPMLLHNGGAAFDVQKVQACYPLLKPNKAFRFEQNKLTAQAIGEWIGSL